MLALLLLICSTLSEEAAQSLGKHSVSKGKASVYSLAFLEVFYALLLMLGVLILMPGNHFTLASLPTLVPRICLEILASYLTAESIVRADRSTVGFLRLLTLPLLLGVDLVLGYYLTPLQISGVLVLFLALGLAFYKNPLGKKGAWIVICLALVNVAAVSLFKYDVTHYNSVAAEQSIVMSCIVIFFFVQSVRSGYVPFKLLIQPPTSWQSLLSGLGAALTSFAVGLAPASIVTALRRTLGLMWSVIFGKVYFKERGLKRKIYAFAVAALGICLLIKW